MGLVGNTGGIPQFLPGAITPDTVVALMNGNTNDLDPPNGRLVSQFFLKPNASLNLTGIAGGFKNRMLRLVNSTVNTVTLKANTGSAGGNQFAFSGDVTMGQNTIVDIEWDEAANGWLLASSGSGGGGGGVTPGGNNVFTGSNEFDGAFLLNGVLTPAALATGTTNDYAPTNLSKSNALRLSGDAGGSSLSGLLATGNGQEFLVVNVGTGLLTFLNQNVGSSATNRFICPGGSDFSIVANGTCTLWYDGTSARYRVFV